MNYAWKMNYMKFKLNLRLIQNSKLPNYKINLSKNLHLETSKTQLRLLPATWPVSTSFQLRDRLERPR